VPDFQNAKHAYQKSAKLPTGYDQEDLDRGFLVTGLWSWCRHPNFAAEQAIWILIYQWGCWTTDTMYNWTIVGAMSYIFLFQGSTWFTESITASKYPEYKEYQQRVARFIPRLTADLPGDFSDQKAPVEARTEAPRASKAKKGRK
jgi:steroid 5-alpha reductase family enzyme